MTSDDARAFAAQWAHSHDEKAKPVSDNLRFNAAGQVAVAEVFHGVTR